MIRKPIPLPSLPTVQPFPKCPLFPGRSKNTDEQMPGSRALESEIQLHFKVSYQTLNNEHFARLNEIKCVKLLRKVR